VNGVLGTIYRELGEPLKDDTSKKHKDSPVEKVGKGKKAKETK
jgi:hypothetical protein